MSKVLHAGVIPGTSQQVVSIYEGGDDAPLSNPTQHMSRMHFDTRFDYLNLVARVDASVSFPYEGITTACGKKGKDCSAIVRSGNRSFTVAAHGQAYTPAIMIYDLSNNRALTGSMFIQVISNTSFRLCWVVVDGTYVYLRERWFVRYNALPALTSNYRIYVFNKPAV
jgi:hypothetical protein